ncbi:unnamed protein product [Amoebophrya sp. A120]|nr:unnamed protein product [Amoebophrya sp. A120]|eukprot:GSA120T00000500001.1
MRRPIRSRNLAAVVRWLYTRKALQISGANRGGLSTRWGLFRKAERDNKPLARLVRVLVAHLGRLRGLPARRRVARPAVRRATRRALFCARYENGGAGGAEAYQSGRGPR